MTTDEEKERERLKEERRKAWMTPIMYNDWLPDAQPTTPEQPEPGDEVDGDEEEGTPEGHTVGGRDVANPPPSPSQRRRVPGEYASNDTTPVNYDLGPHDEPFGDYEETDDETSP